MSESITLTIGEIKALTEAAGLTLTAECLADKGEDDTEITVEECPQKGIDDDGILRKYRMMAYFAEYPEEGCIPLGNEITAKEGA